MSNRNARHLIPDAKAGVAYWRHPVHQDYIVSTDAEVYGTVYGRYRALLSEPRKMSPYPTPLGYYRACLSLGRKIKMEGVHVLVLETFLSPRPKRLVGAHLDNNPANSVLGNLWWISTAENLLFRHVFGTHLMGSNCGMSKFSHDQVVGMRRDRANGHKMRDICERYSVSLPHLKRIIRQLCWGRGRFDEAAKQLAMRKREAMAHAVTILATTYE
jgi:hypothetical protein